MAVFVLSLIFYFVYLLTICRIESLQDLNSSLVERQSRLFVCMSDPVKMFQTLFKSNLIHSVHFEYDSEPYALKRDAQLKELGVVFKVEVKEYVGHTLYDPNDVIRVNHGVAPIRYQTFLKVIEDLPPVGKCLEAPGSLSSVSDVNKSVDYLSQYSFFKDDGQVPTVKDLKDKDPEYVSPHKGGETFALKRLLEYLSDKKKTALFEKPKTSPAAFNPASTTVLSPYLKVSPLHV